MQNLKVKSKFQKLLNPLTEDEFETLKEQCVAAGEIRDPIVTWNGFIVDGHHRYKIATSCELSFSIHELPSSMTEEQVRDYIIQNQVGRRNVTVNMSRYLRGCLLRSRVGEHGGNTAERDGDAAAQLAEEQNVSRRTLFGDAQLSEAVDSLAAPLQRQWKTGELKLARRHLTKLAELAKAEQQEIVERVAAGTSTYDSELGTAPQQQLTGRDTEDAAQQAEAVDLRTARRAYGVIVRYLESQGKFESMRAILNTLLRAIEDE